jgi:hypothetical protein
VNDMLRSKIWLVGRLPVFQVYYGRNKHRHYTQAQDKRWFFRERYFRTRFGIDIGWSKWSIWQVADGDFSRVDEDTIFTSLGYAYRIQELTRVKYRYVGKNIQFHQGDVDEQDHGACGSHR